MRSRQDDAGPDDFDPPCEVCGVDPDNCKCPTCPKCGVVGDMSCYHQHGLQDLIQQSPELLALAKLCRDVIDDDLENRPARHSLGNLHARLNTIITKIEGENP